MVILCLVINVKDELIYMTLAWDKEKSESLTGIEPMTSRTPGRHSIHRTELRELIESKVILTEFICDRRVVLTNQKQGHTCILHE